MNVKDANGWRPVDTGLVGAQGRVTAKAQPLSPSLADRANDPAAMSVQVDGKRAALTLDHAAASPAKVTGSRATYENVLADTDLTYDITAGSVKETIVLRKPGVSSWRFRLSTSGLTPRLEKFGGVSLVDDAGTVKMAIPPVEVWDSAGKGETAPAMTDGSYQVERAGDAWWLTVSVDDGWLRDPKRVYPVNVDPSVTFVTGETHSYRSDGYVCDQCGLRIGNSQFNGDSYNRAVFKADYSSLFGQNVVGARLDVTRNTDVVGSVKTWPASLFHAAAFNFNGVGSHMADGLVGDVGSFSAPEFTAFVKMLVDQRNPTAFFMLIGAEQAGTWTYKNLSATLTVDTGSPPPAATLGSPADGSVITSMTPTLSVNPVTDPDGDAVTYCFKVATGADAKSGVVVDSGCLPTPSWTVPPGVLQDGVPYTWQASTYSGTTMTAPPWVGHVKVDQRIGSHGPSPVDSSGPFTVNLANGNVSTQQASPTFTTVGGNAGLTFTYNSQQQSDQTGLKTSYFVDLSHNGLINDSQQPVLVRTEPQVNVNWGTDSPFPPALPADWFVVRWEGFFQAPVTGSYQFAGVHDDGAVVWINNAKVYDVSTVSDVNWTQSTAVNLTAGQRVPIKVELAEQMGSAQLRLFVRTSDGTTVAPQIVPPGWLYTSDLPALPTGWTLSTDVDGDGTSYTDAKVTDQSVVLTDATGAKHTWTKASTGGYTAPSGEVGILAVDSGGRVTMTEGAEVYSFRVDGKLDTQSSTKDSRKPATLQNLYSSTPSRLKEIKDPVSGRSHLLHYNQADDNCYGDNTPPPPGGETPPTGMLCRITYWDGSETKLVYTSGGKLGRILDPGSETTDYGYDSNGLMVASRSPLVQDWISADPTTRSTYTDLLAEVGYDLSSGKPKATTVTLPAPAHGQGRPKHTYRYDPTNLRTFVDTAGLSPAIGFSSKFTYDDSDRTLSTTDATGKVSSQTWNVKDQKLTSTDPAGRVSTTVYDYADRQTDTYGPAPGSCFNGQLPTAACAATVPHSHTNYDEGMKGLSIAYYDNETLTGAPKVYATGIGDPDGKLVRNWGEAAPVDGIPADHFSLRATGEIVFPQAGDYTLRVQADDGVRIWVDDQNIVDSWINTSPIFRQGTVHVDTPGTVKRIRLEYFEGVGGADLELHWTTPSGVQEPVPTLRPRYGLTTSTVTSESDGVADKTTATKYDDSGLDPVFGLATRTITDPNGNQLTDWPGYEPLGTGYLRRVNKTMPNGVLTAYSFYGDTETRANPCVAGSPAVNQGGMAKTTTSPTPAAGPARVDEQVYDSSGRVVAKSTAGDWTCTTYDARGRVTDLAIPASATSGGRTVHHDFAVNGDPLTSSTSDNAGTITSVTDLLGRVVSYTDVYGTKTETTYDQTGRSVSEKVTPPNPADPPQVTTPTYDDAGRVLSTKLDSTVLATVTYDAAGEIASVSYANGSSLSAIGKDAPGRTISQTWKTSDGHEVTSAVDRTRAGTIFNETLGGVDARPNAPNYVYDTAGRMTEAWMPGHHYSYDFTSLASAACPTGTRSNAGTNTDRVRLLDQTASGTAETGYCYDAADRLLATTGAGAVTGVQYNAHGDTTEFTSGTAVTTFAWDGADRNTYAKTTGADPAVVSYTRDATDRIVRRQVTQGDQTTDVLYGNTGTGDTADLVLKTDKRLTARSISLPGGVLYTTTGTWDHSTIRGDICLTTDANGKQVGDLRTYDPFGEPLKQDGTVDPDNVPDNMPGQMDYGWLGQHQRLYEHAGSLAIVQMGARPYSPFLGRFLAVDPVEGGSANDYDYVDGNPINKLDLDGRCRWSWKFWERGTCTRSFASGAFHVARFTVNAPFTALAMTWAGMHGGRCSLQSGLMVACTGMNGGYGPRRGLTIGNAYLTGANSVDSRLLRHESVHASQWSLLGPFFPLAYGAAELIWPGARNPFERMAGLSDGCYVWRGGC